ncbi:diguanylate cyclase [Clostridium sp. SYSU_GA19001]|uniref:diguanylate cyclase n=1 Tax=Clostridium caldaquaticum TaxID=2940653 RepID=UPI00207790A5|nr:diguanylate cyclase [Clostridium caldaquaticum]MCM8710259.1 diguanylate cyclase [Clostridium caldaquaticum]
MIKIDSDKSKQISNILSVVKLSSLLFSGLIFLEYFLGSDNPILNYSNSAYTLFWILGILILTSIYFIWTFSAVKKFNRYIHLVQTIENFAILLIFFMVILLSGVHKSEFKFLFLFIIITTTIQSGMKQGIFIASISSFLMLTMDLVCSPGTAVNQYFQNDLTMAGVFLLTAWSLGFYVKTANDYIEELKSLVNKDGLTGVYNHRYFHDALREKIKACEKENAPISVVFIDIDYFKHYNDLYGHQKGDEILSTIGSLLKNSVRKNDIVARYGGEEFAIIMPDASEKEAFFLAETIRKKVEETYFEGEEYQPNGRLTVSIGVSVYPDKAKNDIDLIKSADDALYRAKFFNKNRVETYTSILDELKKDIAEEHIDLVTSVKTLISVINAKDKYTYGHVERVVTYCRMLADKLGLSKQDKQTLIYGAYMHDIGKINIAKDVLIKKMPLTQKEWEMLKQHPVNGVDIIKPVDSLNNIIPLILYHHERYDGKGYPDNLRGENIPYLARVLTVVDSFDAMTSNRPYNKRKTYDEAIAELKKCSGTQFDPVIAHKFIEVIKENRNSFDY